MGTDSEKLVFADEGIEKKPKRNPKNTWKIMIVDDDREVHEITKIALNDFVFERKSLEFISAYSAVEATQLIELHPDTALIILDVIMEDDYSGLYLVKYIREVLKNRTVRIVLRTGQPGNAPERDVILSYDINDYKEKSELTNRKLFSMIVSSLRSYRDITELNNLRSNLEEKVKDRTMELIELNERLQKEITERKEAEQKIKVSLNDKVVLLKEIHHRVKNNLQVISSLLDLQSECLKDRQSMEVIKESQNRIRSMSLIHEKLYQSKDLGKIDFSEYIQDLADSLFCSYELQSAINLLVNVEDVFLNIDTSIPCGLIINELISNSLKHAFPNGRDGEIRIDLSSDKDGNYTLIFRDNGVGLPEGMDLMNTDSLGLQLINGLSTEQLNGTIHIEGNNGTSFTIQFSEIK